jgi:hypothetical protein
MAASSDDITAATSEQGATGRDLTSPIENVQVDIPPNFGSIPEDQTVLANKLDLYKKAMRAYKRHADTGDDARFKQKPYMKLVP